MDFFPFGRVFVQFFLRWVRLIFADGTLSGVIFKKKYEPPKKDLAEKKLLEATNPLKPSKEDYKSSFSFWCPRRHGLVAREVACKASGPGFDSSLSPNSFSPRA